METLMGKLGIYDFFNLVIAGGIFLLGLKILNITDPMSWAYPDNELISIAIIFLMSYILGALIQYIARMVDKKVFKISPKMMQNCLINKEKVIRNSEKLKVYQQEAKVFFENKNIEISKNEFSEEQCEYYFSHCCYYLQIKGQSEKVEKMRGIMGLTNLLMVCFGGLAITGIINIVASFFTGEIANITPAFIFTVAAVISFFKSKLNTNEWVRMVMGTCDECLDLYKE